jgi:hypothetical protein
MHAINLTITFGYLLYDASIITVSFYEGQRFIPDNIADGFIYGINAIIAQNNVSQSNTTKRLLQVVPNLEKVSSSSPIAIVPIVSASDLTTVYPATQINNGPPQAASSLGVHGGKITLNRSSFIPQQQSYTAQVLRGMNFTSSDLSLVLSSLNSSFFSSIMQSDGVIDTNPTILSAIKSLGFIPPVFQKASLAGINNQLFNSLFNTNGFVIMTAADDVDQIYYYEVNPVQNVPKSSALIATTIYY